MELSVGWTRTCSLDSAFTKYLSGATTLSKSISGFILATADMNIGGGLLSPCFAEASSAASSVSVPNRFVVVMVSLNQKSVFFCICVFLLIHVPDPPPAYSLPCFCGLGQGGMFEDLGLQ